jgi:hypothetical protein
LGEKIQRLKGGGINIIFGKYIGPFPGGRGSTPGVEKFIVHKKKKSLNYSFFKASSTNSYFCSQSLVAVNVKPSNSYKHFFGRGWHKQAIFIHLGLRTFIGKTFETKHFKKTFKKFKRYRYIPVRYYHI